MSVPSRGSPDTVPVSEQPELDVIRLFVPLLVVPTQIKSAPEILFAMILLSKTAVIADWKYIPPPPFVAVLLTIVLLVKYRLPLLL